MSQWLLVVVLAACGAGFLVIPFLRASAPETPPSSESAGNAWPRAAANDSSSAAAPPRAPASRRRDRVIAAGIAAFVLAGAAGFYVVTWSATETPLAANEGFVLPQQKLPDVDTMIARVAERLKTDPDNAEDWRMIGWSYFETQRYPEAVDAYSHAVSLQPESSAYQSAYGEAQVLAAGGTVTPDAMKAFDTALKAAPNDERALHFVGLLKRQQGDPRGAISDWLRALKNASPDSLWAPRLRAEINETAKLASIDVSAELPAAAPLSEEKFAAPPAQAVQQAQSMTPEEQQSMIKNMVGGLDERLTRNPRDRDGWIRLIRSRKVLGEAELAREALDRALTAFEDDPTTQIQLKTAALQLGVTTAKR